MTVKRAVDMEALDINTIFFHREGNFVNIIVMSGEEIRKTMMKATRNISCKGIIRHTPHGLQQSI